MQQLCVNPDVLASLTKTTVVKATKNMHRLMKPSTSTQIYDYMTQHFTSLPVDFWKDEQDTLECLQLTFPRIVSLLSPKIEATFNQPELDGTDTITIEYPLFFEVEKRGSLQFGLRWSQVMSNILVALFDRLGRNIQLLSVKYLLPPEFIITCTSYKKQNSVLLPLLLHVSQDEVYVLAQMTMSTSRIAFDGFEGSKTVPSICDSSGHHVDVQVDIGVLRISPTYVPHSLSIKTTSTSSLLQQSEIRKQIIRGRTSLLFTSDDQSQQHEMRLFPSRSFPNVVIYQQLGLAQTLALKQLDTDFHLEVKALYFEIAPKLMESRFSGQKFFLATRVIHRVLLQHVWMQCRLSFEFVLDSIKSWKTISRSVDEVRALIDFMVTINPTCGPLSPRRRDALDAGKRQSLAFPVQLSELQQHLRMSSVASHSQFPSRVVVVVTDKSELRLGAWADEVNIIQIVQTSRFQTCAIYQRYFIHTDGTRHCTVTILHATGHLFQSSHLEYVQTQAIALFDIVTTKFQLQDYQLSFITTTVLTSCEHVGAEELVRLNDGVLCCQFISQLLSSFPVFHFPQEFFILASEEAYYRQKFIFEIEEGRVFPYDSFFDKIHSLQDPQQ